MRSVVIAVFAAATAAAACGPSSAELRTAKTATYSVDPGKLMQVAAEATQQEGYKIGDVDEVGHRFITVPRWYNPEGGLEGQGAEGYAQIIDRSVRVALIVEILSIEGGTAIRVTPQTFQHIEGSPKPRELAADDPGLPPFVKGRAESLQLAIYNYAKPYVAK
jgi:hypothetical protein